MELTTPNGLYPKVVSILEDGTTFILCHPKDEAGTDPDISILFRVRSGEADALRIFDRELPGMAAAGDRVFLVDDDCGVYILAGGVWSEWTDMDPRLSRISRLRTVGGALYGLGHDGIVFRWEEPEWVQITDAIPDLYLNDLKLVGSGNLLVSGGRGFLAEIVGRGFDRYDVPTNLDLTCILPMGGETLLVTGWEATALLGQRDEMQFIDPEGRDATFAYAVGWQGRALVSAYDEILELKGNAFAIAWTTRCLGLATLGDYLWKFSNEGVAYLSSGAWIDVPLSVTLDI